MVEQEIGGGKQNHEGIGECWENNPSKLVKFKFDMGHRLAIAKENGAAYELFSNTSIPENIKKWLEKKILNIPNYSIERRKIKNG